MRVRLDDGSEHSLKPLNLVGSAADCHVRIEHPTVEPHHAEISRQKRGWEIVDFGSPNGVWVQKEPLARGGSYLLAVGCRIHVGGERWLEVIDESPPSPYLERVDGGGQIDLPEGQTLLPDAQRPEVSVQLTRNEEDYALLVKNLATGACSDVPPGALLTIGGLEYEVWLPFWRNEEVGTIQTSQQLELRFVFSPNEALIKAEAWKGRVHQSLRSMPFQSRQLLVALIERKQSDMHRGMPESEAGFVTAQQISGELIPGRAVQPTASAHYGRGYAAIRECRKCCHKYDLLGGDELILVKQNPTRYAVGLHPNQVRIERRQREG